MSRRFSLDSFAGINLGVRKSSRLHKGSKQVETLHEAQEKMKELHHSLSNTSLLRGTGDEGHNQSEGLVAKGSFKKHNKTFHKLFEDIPDTEMLTESFTCSLQKEVLYHGKLFVSEEHICFHSSVLLKDTKVVIRTTSVCELKRHKTPLPMLSIHTVDEEKYHLLYVKNSGACFELLKSVCLHVEGEIANNSPHESSAEFDGNGMMSSTSSYEESMNSRNNSISLDNSQLRSPSTGEHTPTTPQDSVFQKEETGIPSIEDIADKTTPQQPPKISDSSFNLIFYIFSLLLLLFLLISGYIGLRIVALEAQLTTLGDLSSL